MARQMRMRYDVTTVREPKMSRVGRLYLEGAAQPITLHAAAPGYKVAEWVSRNVKASLTKEGTNGETVESFTFDFDLALHAMHIDEASNERMMQIATLKAQIYWQKWAIWSLAVGFLLNTAALAKVLLF